MIFKQPNFYKFNEDSIEIVNYAISISNNQSIDIADLGCGCGIIGIDFSQKHMNVDHALFLELQPSFMPYLKENLDHFHGNSFDVIECSFSELPANYDNKFDLILSNPPYFQKGHGRVSTNKNKQLCRTFEQDSYIELFKLMKNLSKQNSVCLFISRVDNQEIKSFIKDKIIKVVKKLNDNRAIFQMLLR